MQIFFFVDLFLSRLACGLKICLKKLLSSRFSHLAQVLIKIELPYKLLLFWFQINDFVHANQNWKHGFWKLSDFRKHEYSFVRSLWANRMQRRIAILLRDGIHYIGIDVLNRLVHRSQYVTARTLIKEFKLHLSG